MLPANEKSEKQSVAVSVLNRTSPLPLYEQIRRRLLSMVLSWPADNERFHTDQELSELFGVSRMTVRQAVQELVNGGFLRRVRGSGTFVCESKVEEQLSIQTSFIDQWADLGQHLQFEVLHCVRESCPESIAKKMALSTEEHVWSIVRRRKIKNIPISVDYRYIPTRVIPVLTKAQIESTSLLQLLSDHAGLSYGNFTVEAILADIERADTLGLLPGDPLLKRSLTYQNEEDQAIMAGVSYYHAGQVRYSFQMPFNKETAKQIKSLNKLEYKALSRG